jgi:hypothetical protein
MQNAFYWAKTTSTPISMKPYLEEVFDLAKKFEYHYTPKKGSWPNMAEIELSALSKQCLDRRIGDIDKLADELGAWEQERNAIRATVRLKINKIDARVELQRQYVNLQNLCSGTLGLINKSLLIAIMLRTLSQCLGYV